MRLFAFILIFLIFKGVSIAQSAAIAEIEAFIRAEQYDQARKKLDAEILKYSSSRTDSLVHFIPVSGRIALKEKPADLAWKEVRTLFEKVISQTSDAGVKISAHLYIAEFSSRASMEAEAYRWYLRADSIAAIAKRTDYNLRGKIQNNLATAASRMNNMSLNAAHQAKAEALIKKAPNPDYHTLYLIYNAKGSKYYFAYQLDSAAKYYNEAQEALRKSDRDSLQKIFSVAIVSNNLAGIYGLQGKSTTAAEAMKQTIEHLSAYLRDERANEKREEATEFLYEATDNLGGIYKNAGDFHRALHLLKFSYEGKKKHLPPGASAIFKSEVLLGQLYYAMRDFQRARQFLTDGLQKIPTDDEGYYFWQADAHYTLALLHDACKEPAAATREFEKADSLYQLALGGSFDNIYLELLNQKALFYAEQRKLDAALRTAGRVNQYTAEYIEGTFLQPFLNEVNMAKIYFNAGAYGQAKSAGLKAQQLAADLLQQNARSLFDSVRIEKQLPEVMLLTAKASYQLLSKPDIRDIQNLLADLEKAKSIYERRKLLLLHEGDVSLVREEFLKLTDFQKKLLLDIRALAGDRTIPEEVIHLHETNVYHKIRSSLDRNENVSFGQIPPSVKKREEQIKAALSDALNAASESGDALERYFKASADWELFTQMLQRDYPKYYYARYATPPGKALPQVMSAIPSGVTVVRYFLMADQWYAWVADRQKQSWIELAAPNITEMAGQLAETRTEEAQVCSLSNALHDALWRPLERFITNQRVIIIPDGVLYYISFDMLSPSPVRNFKSLAESALLHQYAISYHYSLLALGEEKSDKQLKGVSAFVPIFSDQQKQQYMQQVDAAAGLSDEEYLNLLPLPFSEKAARQIRRIFGGRIYEGAASTKQAFSTHAGNNSIIFIGTHAESNEQYPEFSRLIFAKDPEQPQAENSLYIHDIYQYDMTSDLTVLTACESGRPGLFPGEGMISMAHAFKYAGSNSILTGLWKIDEQASAKIVELFHKNLGSGMTKDVALQQAKIQYIKEAQGRTIAPDYWAGLVMMGNVEAIDAPMNSRSMLIFAFAIILLGVLFWRLRRSFLQR